MPDPSAAARTGMTGLWPRRLLRAISLGLIAANAWWLWGDWSPPGSRRSTL